MDIGAVVKSPMQDPDWVKKVLTMGAFNLIPIAGQLNAAGWAKEVYRRQKAGDTTLPDAGFGYISGGVDVFVAWLPAFILNVVVNLVFGLPGMVLGSAALRGLGSLVAGLAGLAIGLVFTPALMYRHFVHNTGFSGGMDVAGIKQVVTTNTSQFINFVLVWFIGGVIFAVGFPLCCVGAAFTGIFGLAVMAAGIKGFEDDSGGI